MNMQFSCLINEEMDEPCQNSELLHEFANIFPMIMNSCERVIEYHVQSSQRIESQPLVDDLNFFELQLMYLECLEQVEPTIACPKVGQICELPPSPSIYEIFEPYLDEDFIELKEPYRHDHNPILIDHEDEAILGVDECVSAHDTPHLNLDASPILSQFLGKFEFEVELEVERREERGD
jgi:hypothetical protein